MDKKFDKIWDAIDEDLSVDFLETNREALHRAINQLPYESAPDFCWDRIEESLNQSRFKIHTTVLYKVAAALLVLIGIGVILFYEVSSSNKVQYAVSNVQDYNLNELSDTTNKTFQELKNSACSLKPTFCMSEEFRAYESEYAELQASQTAILEKSSMYQDEHMEAMMLKIEQRKKKIEQYLIHQLNS